MAEIGAKGYVDSDEVPVAVLLQGDDISASDCAECGIPGKDFPRRLDYHPVSRPAAIFQAALYCADCMPRSYNDEGAEVRTFCGRQHLFTAECDCFN